jgi:hypothetical protein
MNFTRLCALAVAALVSAGCASRGRYSPENDPVALAAVRAELRLVGSETTWVTRGHGYELIGRSKADLVALQSPLDREAAMIQRVFPADTIAPLVVTVRRAVAAGQPFVSAAPYPTTVHGPVVEVVLPDPKAKRDPEKGSPAAALGIGLLAERTPTLPVVRAWLSAHASAAMGVPARSAEATGEFEDPRIPDGVSSTGSRVLTGILVGGVAGAIGGYAVARHEVNHCSPRDCGGGPALDVVVDPIVFGAVGAAVGGLVGWLWPHR